MTREEALNLIKANIKNENTIKHMLATEAIMRALARKFGENEEEWGLAGLVHDIDLDIVGDDMTRHSKVGAEMLKEKGFNESVVHAVLTHNEAHGVPRKSQLDSALFCTDPLTGLIVAAALVRPDKKLANLEAKSVLKRFKEKSFAAGANRAVIAQSCDIGLTLEEFVGLGLEAMKGSAGELGL
ncbi:MAG: HD domain-containing protein [Chloroflexi bacterium]|nr:HD domain-containing protein [Chloroflexota bacterium]